MGRADLPAAAGGAQPPRPPAALAQLRGARGRPALSPALRLPPDPPPPAPAGVVPAGVVGGGGHPPHPADARVRRRPLDDARERAVSPRPDLFRARTVRQQPDCRPDRHARRAPRHARARQPRVALGARVVDGAAGEARRRPRPRAVGGAVGRRHDRVCHLGDQPGARGAAGAVCCGLAADVDARVRRGCATAGGAPGACPAQVHRGARARGSNRAAASRARSDAAPPPPRRPPPMPPPSWLANSRALWERPEVEGAAGATCEWLQLAATAANNAALAVFG
jgi:hypothetical protein